MSQNEEPITKMKRPTYALKSPRHLKEEGEPVKKERKRRRYKPGTIALRQIKKYQSGTDFLIKRAPFRRFVKEIISEFDADYRLGHLAIDSLQTACEAYLIEQLGKANICAIYSQRKTVRASDLNIVRSIQNLGRL